MGSDPIGLGLVYVFAFLGLIFQGPGLIGSHGLTPAAQYVDALNAAGRGFWDEPSLFMFGASDAALTAWAYVGLLLASTLLAVDPFDGNAPKWIRMRRFIYKMQPYSADAWWSRELVDANWVPPINKDTLDFRAVIERYGWLPRAAE